MSLPGIRIAANGKAIASADRLAFIALPDRRTQLDSIVTIRGIDLAAFTLRPEIRITKGRNYHPGTREVIVGRAALRRVAGLEIGNLLTPGEWLVVGSFESNGDARESEILADGESLALALSASSINSITLMLEHAGALSAFRDALTADPTLPVVVRRESDYFSEASADTRRALRGIGYLVGGIMALGAIVTMLSTMFSVVSKRTGEIATLRAIGFSPSCIAASVLLEILLLAAFGAAIGTCMAWLFFDGNSVSILSSASPAQITYSLAVSDMLVLTSATCAFLVAVFAGSFPALRAARLPIAAALRAI
jgi:putative ABC transport system permease protein